VFLFSESGLALRNIPQSLAPEPSLPEGLPEGNIHILRGRPEELLKHIFFLPALEEEPVQPLQILDF
jgi:hypothetical protein